MTHKLKIDEQYFNAVNDGIKNFEIRYNDRNFRVGDVILLQEVTQDLGFTGREITGVITYITNYEQKEGYIVFNFRRI